MLAFINEHLNNRNLVHALMTCINSYIVSEKKVAQEQTKLIGDEHILLRIENKLDELTNKLQSGHFNFSSSNEPEISKDELDDLLKEYTF